MDYQEVISSYNNKGLDITSLKQKLEIAKPLKGRLKYRAIDIISQRSAILNDINNLLITLEKPDKIESFNYDIKTLLCEYFSILIESISRLKAWKFMKLNSEEYTLEEFEKLNKKEQFKKMLYLNREYSAFLEYQNIADIRDCLKNADDLNDDIIRKLEFLRQMFDKFKNKELKIEFFCFDKNFLMTLIWFRKWNGLKFEDFMKTRKKNIQEEYKKFSQFFTSEDFRNVSENLDLTSKTLKTSVNNIIEAYSEMSESEAEVYYIQEEFEQFKELLKKFKRMQIIEKEYEKEKKEREKIKSESDRIDNTKKITESNLEKTKKNNKNVSNISKIKNIDNQVPKEQVNPLIFTWFEREDITLTKRIGMKNLTKFFDKIKGIENKTGIRVSLYIVTNAGKEVTLKRLEEFKKKAAQNGLANLVEGALGGYSSFKIDKKGKIKDIVGMTNSSRQKIINILEKSKGMIFSRDLIDETEQFYIRYQMTDKKDKSINKKYLNLLVNNLLKDDNIRNKPLKFLSFVEGKKAGIDVLFEEQLKGISQLSEYYKEKYLISSSKTLNARIDNIESFLEE